MNKIPVLDEDQKVLGHVPNRASKNKILGVIPCECGNVCTIHNPRGKRANHFYTICDDCGTDQRSGHTVQAKIRAQMVPYLENLGSKPEQHTQNSHTSAVNPPKQVESEQKSDIAIHSQTEDKPEIVDKTEKIAHQGDDFLQNSVGTSAGNVDNSQDEVQPEEKETDYTSIGIWALVGAGLGAVIGFVR